MPISQNASASAGDASVSLTNSSALTISALANAKATGQAVASAAVHGATTHLTSIATSGGGTILVPTSSSYGVIHQNASAVGGDASASINNSGALTISANAEATGSAASANAVVTSAIHQNAHASAAGTGATLVLGNANASIANDGAIAINAIASAHATSGFAAAHATNKSGIEQQAVASGDGDATASLTSTGTIDLGALAHAVSTGSSAFAFASQGHGISQEATALGGGDANAAIDLASLNLHATALAAGAAAFARAVNKSGTRSVCCRVLRKRECIDHARRRQHQRIGGCQRN